MSTLFEKIRQTRAFASTNVSEEDAKSTRRIMEVGTRMLNDARTLSTLEHALAVAEMELEFVLLEQANNKHLITTVALSKQAAATVASAKSKVESARTERDEWKAMFNHLFGATENA